MQVAPKSDYHSKYSHLIGLDSALSAAKPTETNIQYGMVSAEEKKDRRTVEDIQADMREKKRMKLDQGEKESLQ